MKARLASCAIATVLLLALPAHAVEAGGLPAPRQAGAVAYVSGGVGDDEAAQFRAAFDQYPLVVQLFSNSGGRNDYTSDAVVKIVDAAGSTRFEQKADGPFMLIRIAPGNYRVSATLNGSTLPAKQVQVPGRGHVEATFVFRNDEVK